MLFLFDKNTRNIRFTGYAIECAGDSTVREVRCLQQGGSVLGGDGGSVNMSHFPSQLQNRGTGSACLRLLLSKVVQPVIEKRLHLLFPPSFWMIMVCSTKT